jgi:hypothetical protein
MSLGTRPAALASHPAIDLVRLARTDPLTAQQLVLNAEAEDLHVADPAHLKALAMGGEDAFVAGLAEAAALQMDPMTVAYAVAERGGISLENQFAIDATLGGVNGVGVATLETATEALRSVLERNGRRWTGEVRQVLNGAACALESKDDRKALVISIFRPEGTSRPKDRVPAPDLEIRQYIRHPDYLERRACAQAKVQLSQLVQTFKDRLEKLTEADLDENGQSPELNALSGQMLDVIVSTDQTHHLDAGLWQQFVDEAMKLLPDEIRDPGSGFRDEIEGYSQTRLTDGRPSISMG